MKKIIVILITAILALTTATPLVLASDGPEEEWNKTFGGSSMKYANSVQQTSDGGYIIAGCTYNPASGSLDVLLIKVEEFDEQNVNDGNGEAGSCSCSSASVDVSVRELAIGWGIIGLCWGSGYYFVRKRNKH